MEESKACHSGTPNSIRRKDRQKRPLRRLGGLGGHHASHCKSQGIERFQRSLWGIRHIGDPVSCLTPSSQTPGASITVDPGQVDIGTTATVTLFSGGFFDLSAVKLSQVGVRPGDGVSNLKIESATAQRMKLSFKISSDASIGVRTVFIKRPRTSLPLI
jgi:hypothetical protein